MEAVESPKKLLSEIEQLRSQLKTEAQTTSILKETSRKLKKVINISYTMDNKHMNFNQYTTQWIINT